MPLASSTITFDCPRCGHPITRVIDTRRVQTNRANSILRYRKCSREDCGYTFHTTERLYGRPSSKCGRGLTLGQVKKIRKAWKTSGGALNQSETARYYKVSKKTIWNIVHEEQWVMPIRKAKLTT